MAMTLFSILRCPFGDSTIIEQDCWWSSGGMQLVGMREEKIEGVRDNSADVRD
jgi:hypothetical protein